MDVKKAVNMAADNRRSVNMSMDVKKAVNTAADGRRSMNSKNCVSKKGHQLYLLVKELLFKTHIKEATGKWPPRLDYCQKPHSQRSDLRRNSLRYRHYEPQKEHC